MTENPPPASSGTPALQRCYRHPERDAFIRCQRCEQLICPECMRDAAVGFQCPTCVKEGARTVRTARTVAGGAIPANAGSITMGIIAVNVLVFVFTDVLRLTGVRAEGGMTALGIVDGEYWRLVTSAFLHFGLIHLLFNMYALYLFGPFAERSLGTVRYVASYLTVSVVSSVFVYWLSPVGALTAGASGAVFGLFGMVLLLMLKAGQDVRGLLVLLAINGFISTLGNISWQGHLGGFVAGLLLGAAFAYAPRERRTLVHVTVFALLWVGVVVGILTRTADLMG